MISAVNSVTPRKAPAVRKTAKTKPGLDLFVSPGQTVLATIKVKIVARYPAVATRSLSIKVVSSRSDSKTKPDP
jgi:hypothetical protein